MTKAIAEAVSATVSAGHVLAIDIGLLVSLCTLGAFIVAAVRGYMNLSCRFKAVEDDSKKLAKAQGVLLEGIYAALIGDELTVNAAAEKLRAHLFDRREI